jgi:glutamyl-Q tRNA(Asp) synthetase
LHLGSLTTALASFLEARSRGGRWLLRIDDLDTQRCVPGMADELISTLAALGLESDERIAYQSQSLSRYDAAIETLMRDGRTYPCGCSRRELAESDSSHAYNGRCRLSPRGRFPHALRFVGDDLEVSRFADAVQGPQRVLWQQRGDPIIRRRDQLIAYQLAVVVDDHDAGVTDVVRGADLLDSTPWQIALQKALRLPQPQYAHLPLVVQADGSKLSKSAHSVAITASGATASAWLFRALALLRQEPPNELRSASPGELLQWATAHWRLDRLYGLTELQAASP